MRTIDNIKIAFNENHILIKKGWIRKKYISYYFIIIFILLIASIILIQASILKEKKIIYAITIILKSSVVFAYWLYFNKKIVPAFLLENIEMDFYQKELKFEGHRKNYIIPFHKIKDIAINKNTENSSRKIYRIKIIDFSGEEYLFGFALSNHKGQEIREILINVIEKEKYEKL